MSDKVEEHERRITILETLEQSRHEETLRYRGELLDQVGTIREQLSSLVTNHLAHMLTKDDLTRAMDTQRAFCSERFTTIEANKPNKKETATALGVVSAISVALLAVLGKAVDLLRDLVPMLMEKLRG